MPPDVTRLRWIGLAEGVSCLLLFGVAMPLKYLADQPLAVKITGSIHGGLVIAYCLALALVMLRQRWPLGRGVALFVAMIVPGGPFVMDRRLARWAGEGHASKTGINPTE